MADGIRCLDDAPRDGARGHACSGWATTSLNCARAITDWKPDIAFNLLEEFQGIVTYDQYVVAFLELMRQPYTGCNPRGLMISRDKALSKQILAYHRIPNARFALAAAATGATAYRRRLNVSAVREIGDRGRVARDRAGLDRPRRTKLQERVEFIHEQTNSDALVEEYIEGRELYIGVTGNERLDDVSALGARFRHPAGGHGRDRDPQGEVGPEVSAQARHQHRAWAKDLPEGLPARMATLARRIYRALFLTGYARIGTAAASRRGRVRARGQRQSEPREGRDFATPRRRAVSPTAPARQIMRSGWIRGRLAPDLITRHAAGAADSCSASRISHDV